MKKLLILSIAIAFMATSMSTLAQKAKAAAPAEKSELRIGVVDVEKIAKELPEAIEADKKLTDLRAKYLDSIKTMEKKFTDKYEAYTKNKSMMTGDAQKKEEDELRTMQAQYSNFQEENFGNNGTLAKKRNELLQPVLAKIQEAIQLVAKEEHLSMVFDKGASAVLVYADDKFDVTHKIIDRMKRGK